MGERVDSATLQPGVNYNLRPVILCDRLTWSITLQVNIHQAICHPFHGFRITFYAFHRFPLVTRGFTLRRAVPSRQQPQP